MYRKWTDEQLVSAVKTSTTKFEVLKKLGLYNNSGNYQTIDKYIKMLDLNTSHFKNEVFKVIPKKYCLEDILIKDSKFSSTVALKKKLIKASILKEECNLCGILEWTGRKLNLHIDHINGDNTDNRIENLRLLCPNCHSLTPTYCRGMNRQSKKKCLDCNAKITKSNSRCQECSGKKRQMLSTKWPDVRVLQAMVENLGYVKTGKNILASDNAVRKNMKRMSNLAVIGTCDKCQGPATHRIVKIAHIQGTFCEECCPVTKSTMDLLKRNDLFFDEDLKKEIIKKAEKNGVVE